MHRSISRCAGWTLTDLSVCLVLLLLLLAGCLPSLSRSRETADRVKCASNLRQIGQAMLLYANENRQQWPRTIHDPANPAPTEFTGVNASKPFEAGGPAPNDVTAAFYLLVRTQDIGTEAFICPSDTATPAMILNPTANSNFISRDNLSYSLANPYPDAAAITAGYRWNANQSPEFAVAADMNPGTPALLMVTASSPSAQLKSANSYNHAGNGQNILYGDGHAEFMATPFAGSSRDNIYTAGLSGIDRTTDLGPGTTIGGTPAHATDSVLLPALPPGAPRPGSLASEGPLPLLTIFLIGTLLFFLVVVVIVLLARRKPPGTPPPLAPPPLA